MDERAEPQRGNMTYVGSYYALVSEFRIQIFCILFL